MSNFDNQQVKNWIKKSVYKTNKFKISTEEDIAFKIIKNAISPLNPLKIPKIK